MAKKYVGSNTLLALVTLVKAGLKAKIDVTSIANNLETSDLDKVLGASQAKAILDKTSEQISTVTESLTTLTQNSMAKDVYDADGDGVVDKANEAETAKSATTATRATTADSADTATTATRATTADSADTATNATNADKAKDSDKLGGIEASQFIQKNKDGQIDSNLLPSYVDDVVEGYYHEGYFYKSDHTSEAAWPEDDRMTGETGKIYVDVLTSTSYRYSGSTYVQIVSSDMVEITGDEVNQIWTAEVSA